jgi:hypothetical protein
MLIAPPPTPLQTGFLFPRESVLDHLFQVSSSKRPFLKMYLGYSGQGKTTAMQMAMAQFRQVDGANFCVRACHVSFRESAVFQDADLFVASFSQAIGGYNGTRSVVPLFRRLFSPCAQSSLSFATRRLFNTDGRR